jgi:CDP-paratose 2-epimerase
MPAICDKKILITGGLGFIGTNVAARFFANNKVLVIDDASRQGVENNLAYLQSLGVPFRKIDISNFKELRAAFQEFSPEIIVHMAAQVAVTLSVENPAYDFRCNVIGTLNLLELARHQQEKPFLIFASTNKVYGTAKSHEISLQNQRYGIKNTFGLDEETPLSFETPYGCSKGSADQYVLDYYRTYQIPTVVLRQSCIYGPHQFGLEDQGWVAWFCILAHFGRPITIYGDGYQVRDVLYIDDLLNVIEKCMVQRDSIKGQVFNIGGGPGNTLTPHDLVEMLKKINGKPITVEYKDWRPRDQKVYISDIRKAQQLLGWAPKISPEMGVRKYLDWIHSQKEPITLFHEEQIHKRKYQVSIVIPARNEAACLEAVLDEINVVLATSSYRYEVIVVNDRSSDRTVEIAQQYPFVKVIDSVYPPGKGGALRSGFDVAQGEYLLMMDADFSHNAADIPSLVEEVMRHKGLVLGSRITGGSEEYTRVRAFGNIIFTWFFGFVHGRYLSDALNGFKIFHRDIYQAFIYSASGFEIEIELLANTLRCNRTITEVPSRERMRLDGRLKSSVVRDGMRFLLRIIMEKFRKPQLRHKQDTALDRNIPIKAN